MIDKHRTPDKRVWKPTYNTYILQDWAEENLGNLITHERQVA